MVAKKEEKERKKPMSRCYHNYVARVICGITPYACRMRHFILIKVIDRDLFSIHLTNNIKKKKYNKMVQSLNLNAIISTIKTFRNVHLYVPHLIVNGNKNKFLA